MATAFLKRLLPLVVALAASAALATQPYDESADAKAALQEAKAAAARNGRPLLVVFGANWCFDCRVLARAMADEPLAGQLASAFQVLKIDVGNFDRNLDVVAAYGNPIGKGIPAIVLLAADGTLIYATRAGELANARRMGDDGIGEFFRQLAAKARQ